MHSLCRCASRSWPVVSAGTCQAAFSTCRPSMNDLDRNMLPYQSLGWVSNDLEQVKREPWMKAAEVKKQRKLKKPEWVLTPGHDITNRVVARKVESAPLSGPSSSKDASEKSQNPTNKHKVTALSGAITMAKSASAMFRSIAREIIPEFTKGLPPPAAKEEYHRRARPFVPIVPLRSSGYSSPSTSSLRHGERHPESIYGHDNSLEEYFGGSSRRDLALPYLDTDEYARNPKKPRPSPESVSGLPTTEWKRSAAKLLRPARDGDAEEEDFDDHDVFDRPDSVEVDPSRLPRVGTISRLPKAAEIEVETLEDGSQRLRRSGRLWRSAPIILSDIYSLHNQRRSPT